MKQVLLGRPDVDENIENWPFSLRGHILQVFPSRQSCLSICARAGPGKQVRSRGLDPVVWGSKCGLIEPRGCDSFNKAGHCPHGDASAASAETPPSFPGLAKLYLSGGLTQLSCSRLLGAGVSALSTHAQGQQRDNSGPLLTSSG